MKVDRHSLNSAEFIWGPQVDCGVYIKVHCISTEFTAKKHGGEKGVPFRLQVDTFALDTGEHLHSAASQIKVFKVSSLFFLLNNAPKIVFYKGLFSNLSNHTRVN